jgi:hypothetical protein
MMQRLHCHCNSHYMHIAERSPIGWLLLNLPQQFTYHFQFTLQPSSLSAHITTGNDKLYLLCAGWCKLEYAEGNRTVCRWAMANEVIPSAHGTSFSGLSVETFWYTVVPPYPRVIRSKTYRGCPKPRIVANPIYKSFFIYIYTYDKV